MPFILPQINYIIFQLVSFDPADEDVFTEEKVISLAVMPTMIDYTLTSRDAVYQTQTIFTDKFPIAPVRCALSGTTGNLPRPEQLSLMDGFGRLKELELLFRRSHSVNDESISSFIQQQGMTLQTKQNKHRQKVYGLNYYDFIFHQFFRINLQSFHFSGNARVNTKLTNYDLQFISAGEQYGLKSSDPLLVELTAVMNLVRTYAQAVNQANDYLTNSIFIQGITYVSEALGIASQYSTASLEIVNKLSASINNTKSNTQGLVPLWT